MKPANVAMVVVGSWMGLAAAGRIGGDNRGAGGWGVSAVALAASSDVEGRKHARKANHLADTNKCKQAIPEYTKALRLLKDPTLLFNRAECYRRTGDSTKAVADYRKFLSDLPGAPNRAQVEGQIAALDKSAATSAPAPRSTTAARSSAAATPPAPSPESEAAPVPVSPPRSGGSAPSFVDEPVREAPATAEHEAPDLDRPRSPRRSRPPAERTPAPALLDSASTESPSADAEPSSRWWAWVLGAVVIAGGATATYFAVKQGKTEIPSSTLGNFRF